MEGDGEGRRCIKQVWDRIVQGKELTSVSVYHWGWSWWRLQKLSSMWMADGLAKTRNSIGEAVIWARWKFETGVFISLLLIPSLQQKLNMPVEFGEVEHAGKGWQHCSWGIRVLWFVLCWRNHSCNWPKWNTTHSRCHRTSPWWNLGKMFAICSAYLEGQTTQCH